MNSNELIRLTLAYNGDGFHGWQSQTNGTGIQDIVEKCLATFLRYSVRLTSASRTDTGVHAEQQEVTFRAEKGTDLRKLVLALNALLPANVKVRDAKIAPPEFHPIRSAKAKAYRYRIWTADGISPFVVPYVWHNRNRFDVEKMRVASSYFIGQHDFTTFCAADSSSKTKVRTIIDISIEQNGPMLEFWFLGEGFLKQMIRILVGTLADVGLGKLKESDMAALLGARNRISASKTAPAQGLCLANISYDDVPTLSALRERSSKGYNLSLDGAWAEFS